MALAGLLVIGYLLVFFTGGSPRPKLGLDLKGGTTVTLQARGKTPSKADLDTARDIIENRVNGLGVANSDVVTQGNNEIVISVPGKNGDQVKQLGATAQLYFRPVTAQLGSATSPSPTSTPTPTPTQTPSPTATGQRDVVPPVAAPRPSPSKTPSASKTPAGSKTPSASATPTPAALPSGVPRSLAPDMNKSCSALAKQNADANPAKPIIACTQNGKNKYALGPALFKGTEVKNARAQYDTQTNQWVILLDLKGHGQQVWSDYTSKHNASATPNDVANFVGFVLDGYLLGSPPEIQGTITGTTQITGSFSSSDAKTLANNFKYGALPLSFDVSNAQTISATLGSGQLRAGLLAGGIGLGLVVIYSLLYYRALGLVTIASLVISGLMVYASVVLLGRQLNFTLTLAGIAGFIVAVGITADSFVVFFERLKEEVYEGRSMRSGVPRAWLRARRTILSADAVSFLAAAILYYLAAGEVKGFAFTLGLSTILDLIVVFLFTHPLVALASRSKTFSSPRWSGLKAVQAARAEALAATSAPGAAERAAARQRDRVTRES